MVIRLLPRKVRRWLAATLAAAFMVGGLASGAAALSASHSPEPDASSWMLGSLDAAREDTDRDAGPAEPLATPGRLNILLLGIDRRPVQEPDAPALTDGVMVLSVDRDRQTAGILSIPRDLWLPIPVAPDRVLQDRVNSAYAYGEVLGYPGGGPALAKATVEYNLGIRIHRYAVLDFQAFERAIDAIGGVDVDLPAPLVDPAFPTGNYGAVPIALPAGKQHLTGERALWLVRSRYQSSDFSRMHRQQQVLLAARDQVLRLDMAPRLPQLYLQLSDAVRTDVSLLEIADLVRLAWSIPAGRIQTRTIDAEDVYRGGVAADPFALLPNRARIGVLVRDLFLDERTAKTAGQ